MEASNLQSCQSLATLLHSRVYKQSEPRVPKPGLSNQISREIITSSKKVPPVQTLVGQSSTPVSNEITSTHASDGKSLGRKPMECYNCGGNHKRVQCSIKCEFCGKRGQNEAICFSKKRAITETDKNVDKQETKCVQSSSSVNKFYKNIWIDQYSHEAFIDTGSSCSIISERLVRKYSLPIISLKTPATLQGFSNDNTKTVSEIVRTKIKIDSVVAEDVEMYILRDLAGCDILLGRNVTERNDLMYTRVGNTLTFSYVQSFHDFCNGVSEMDLEFDTNSHREELAAVFSKYKKCIASNIKEIGKVNNHEMVIDLNVTKPVYCRPYRTSQSDNS